MGGTIIMSIFAIGLAVAAFQTKGGTRWFLIAACLLNLAGVAKTFVSNEPFFSPDDYDNSYRRP